MKKQMIISISREFGSGGHEIAENIARDLDLKFYDRGMLDEIAENCQPSAGAKITACADEIRDLLIGGN